MIHRRTRFIVVLVGAVLLLASEFAEAQWVMLARRAVGRVEQMSQSQTNGASYDSAAVMIEAPADKVFAAVMRGVRNNAAVKITSESTDTRTVQFTNGTQIAGIKVSALGDDLSHIMVSSAHTGQQPNAAALVSESVLRVCKEMNVECSRAAQ